jgi:hypothetical protein
MYLNNYCSDWADFCFNRFLMVDIPPTKLLESHRSTGTGIFELIYFGTHWIPALIQFTMFLQLADVILC